MSVLQIWATVALEAHRLLGDKDQIRSDPLLQKAILHRTQHYALIIMAVGLCDAEILGLIRRQTLRRNEYTSVQSIWLTLKYHRAVALFVNALCQLLPDGFET